VGDFDTPNPSDYHSFALCEGTDVSCAGRSFYAGAASDGTDIGVDVGLIDNARLKSQVGVEKVTELVLARATTARL